MASAAVVTLTPVFDALPAAWQYALTESDRFAAAQGVDLPAPELASRAVRRWTWSHPTEIAGDVVHVVRAAAEELVRTREQSQCPRCSTTGTGTLCTDHAAASRLTHGRRYA